MWQCECVCVCTNVHDKEVDRNKDRRNGSKRLSRTSVKNELCKSLKARSEFTEQHAHYKPLVMFVCLGWMALFLYTEYIYIYIDILLLQ